MRWCSRFAVSALLMGTAWISSTTGQDNSPAPATPSGTVRAIVTAYCPCVKCCGDFAGKKRGQTASGKMAQPLRTLAAPKDLPFNSEVYIVEGDGSGGRLAAGVCLGTVEDRGGSIKWKQGKSKDSKPILRLDVYFTSHQEALEFGIHGVDVRIVTPKKEKKN